MTWRQRNPGAAATATGVSEKVSATGRTHYNRNTRRAPCPKCDRGPKDRALAITVDERGQVEYCHRCGYRNAQNDSERIARRRIEPQRTPANLKAIWRRTRPLSGTAGEMYLKHRHCALPPADSHLRFMNGGKYPPSLCALVTDPVTAKPMTLHFTRLADDGRSKAGTDCDKSLLGGHPKSGGVIRMWPDESVTHGLGIAEGIETALAAAHAYTPVWATVDADNMRKFPVLAGIETLVLFADHDEAGIRAAQECGTRWADADREARIVLPEQDGTDVADAVAA